MKQKNILIVCLLTAVYSLVPAFADENPKEDQIQPKPAYRTMTFFFGLGATLSPKTSHSIALSTVSAVPTGDTTDSSAAQFQLEGVLRMSQNIGISGILESNKYLYKGDTSGNGDSHLGLMVMPRFELPFETGAFWAGFGGGMMFSKILGGVSTTDTGVTFSGSDQNTSGFEYSPRLGINFRVSDNAVLDFMGAYTSFSGKVTGTYSGAANGTFTDSFTRSWSSIVVRFGISI